MNERLVPADPVRLLLSADSTDLEKELLRSWEGEQPAQSACHETLAALGLGTAAAGGAVAAGGSLAPKAASLGWVALAKWASIGVAALGLVAAGSSALRHPPPRDEQPSNLAPQTAPRALVQHESVTAAPIDVEKTQASPTAAAAPAQRAPAIRSGQGTLDSLADQVAELDRARAALDDGTPERVLRLVDAYEASYPAGALVQEAELLRVEALARAGDPRGAERVAKRFLAAYPKSPHAARVRALVSSAP